MNYFLKLPVLFCLVFAVACTTPEKSVTGDEFVRLENAPSVRITAGAQQTALLDFKIADGYHILADRGEDKTLRFTRLTIQGNDQIQVGDPQFPASSAYEIPETDYHLSIFEKDLPVKIPLSVRAGTARKQHRLTGSLSYQMCNPKKCFFPRALDFQLEVHVQ